MRWPAHRPVDQPLGGNRMSVSEFFMDELTGHELTGIVNAPQPGLPAPGQASRACRLVRFDTRPTAGCARQLRLFEWVYIPRITHPPRRSQPVLASLISSKCPSGSRKKERTSHAYSTGGVRKSAPRALNAA